MKRNKAVNFLTVTLFTGVFLTFMLYIGMGMLMGGFDTEDGEFGFNRSFAADQTFDEAWRFVDYKIFGHIESGNIITGEDEWLFEAVDKDNGYERLLDYIGGSPFEEQELEKIAKKISDRQAAYEKNGMSYVLVVVPDSMTVCSEKVPWYIGKQSENTRLSQVTEYFEQRQIRGLINPVEKMKSESKDILMYNNTENSINAYGAYCLYNTVVARYLADTGREVERIYRDDIEFYTRMTDGLAIAKRAGLADTIANKTVSLTDNMLDNYDVTYNERGLMITERVKKSTANADCVVVECSDGWDRSQLMPYFSNTFDRVYYRDKLSEQPIIPKQYGATLVVQLIHESELANLAK